MHHTGAPDVVSLLAALTEPNATRARERYLQATGLECLDDQAVCQLFEDAVVDATTGNEPVVELSLEFAQTISVMLKGAARKGRGGQRSDRRRTFRLRTLVSLGRQIKAQCIESGMSATEAHLEAAERAADEGRKHQLQFSSEYIARKMFEKDSPPLTRNWPWAVQLGQPSDPTV